MTDSCPVAPPQSDPKRRMDGHFPPAAAALSVVVLGVALSSAALLEPHDLLYDDAVRAFYGGDYRSVVRFMEGALGSHAQLRRTKVRCRLRCQDQHPFDDAFSDLRFFDVVLRRAACVNACVEQKLGSQSLHRVSEDVVQDFNRRIPYNFLQLAYQKVQGWGGGVSALSRGRFAALLHSSSHVAAAQDTS